MTEQWQELKETIKELRYSNGNLTQQEVCSFLGVYMETLEKQMQEPTYAKGTIIKSALKYLVKRQIEEGSVGFAVDNDHDHDCCWDDVLAWIEVQPCSEDIKEAYLKGYDYGVKDWFKSKTQPSEDCISREEVQDLISRWLSDYLLDETRETLETINYKVGDMPSVTPQQDVGKWIKVDPLGTGDEAYMCSKCKTGDWDITIGEYKFCPYCGQKKEGVEDEDRKSL